MVYREIQTTLQTNNSFTLVLNFFYLVMFFFTFLQIHYFNNECINTFMTERIKLIYFIFQIGNRGFNIKKLLNT